MLWNFWSVGLGLALVGLASWAGTAVVLRLLIAWQIFDEPNHRSSHTHAKPRAGGLAMVAVMLTAWMVRLPGRLRATGRRQLQGQPHRAELREAAGGNRGSTTPPGETR